MQRTPGFKIGEPDDRTAIGHDEADRTEHRHHKNPTPKEAYMSTSPAQPVPRRARPSFHRNVAVTRAAAAVLWAIVYLLALHGQRVLTGSDIPALAGLLLAGYPLIDAVASISEWRLHSDRAELRAGVVIDGVAIIGLLIATLSLHSQSVLIAFGAWAVASGLLQLIRAWRSDRSRRVQLPLIISGATSAIAGVSFAAIASQHVAHLPYLGGYAVLGAVFFLIWTVIDRKSPQSS
jgi:hypothetical protein